MFFTFEYQTLSTAGLEDDAAQCTAFVAFRRGDWPLLECMAAVGFSFYVLLFEMDVRKCPTQGHYRQEY